MKTADDIIAEVAIATANESAKNAKELATEWMRCYGARLSRRIESPIERVLLVAYLGFLITTKKIGGSGSLGYYRGIHIFDEPGNLSLDNISRHKPASQEVLPEFDDLWEYDFIAPQVKVGAFRADAIIGCRVSDKRFPEPFLEWVAIECDGHDFHERTKEQAQKDKSRDRFFQSVNLPVLRFTGSEIWANPSKCAIDIDAVLSSACHRESITRMKHSY